MAMFVIMWHMTDAALRSVFDIRIDLSDLLVCFVRYHGNRRWADGVARSDKAVVIVWC